MRKLRRLRDSNQGPLAWQPSVPPLEPQRPGYTLGDTWLQQPGRRPWTTPCLINWFYQIGRKILWSFRRFYNSAKLLHVYFKLYLRICLQCAICHQGIAFKTGIICNTCIFWFHDVQYCRSAKKIFFLTEYPTYVSLLEIAKILFEK